MTMAAILLAGGSGSRVGHEVNKVYLPIRERVVLEYSLETLNRSPLVSGIVLVVRAEDRSQAETVISATSPAKLHAVVTGGATRHQSEMAGLEACAAAIEAGEVDLVAIHDGARPFMTLDLIESAAEAARTHGGAIPGLAIEESLFRVEPGKVTMMPPRTLRRAQTPQVFSSRELLAAYRAARVAGIEGVDTAETVERFSDLEVAMVPGDPRNIKVTFVEDFFAAEEYATVFDKGTWAD